MKTYGAGTVLRIPNLKTRMQVNGQLRAADALSPGEKTPKGTMDRNLVSLQSLCGCCTGHTHTHTHTHCCARQNACSNGTRCDRCQSLSGELYKSSNLRYNRIIWGISQILQYIHICILQLNCNTGNISYS